MVSGEEPVLTQKMNLTRKILMTEVVLTRKMVLIAETHVLASRTGLTLIFQQDSRLLS